MFRLLVMTTTMTLTWQVNCSDVYVVGDDDDHDATLGRSTALMFRLLVMTTTMTLTWQVNCSDV
jgi:hypothetical protein